MVVYRTLVEWGSFEALLVDWLLEQRGANSKTDPNGSVFLLAENAAPISSAAIMPEVDRR
jgi:hypothetical protein